MLMAMIDREKMNKMPVDSQRQRISIHRLYGLYTVD